MLDRHAALPLIKEDDRDDDDDRDGDIEQQVEQRFRALTGRGVRLRNVLRITQDDADENDERYAVADAFVTDLLAEPHQEERAAHHCDDCVEQIPNARVVKDSGTLHRDRHKGRLNRAEHDRQPTRVLANLLTAFLAAFLRHLFELRHHDRHELHDDRRVDVGRDAHRDDGKLLQRATRQEAEQVIERAALQHALPRFLVYVGQLHVDHEDEPRKREENEENPLADLRHEHRRPQVIEH